MTVPTQQTGNPMDDIDAVFASGPKGAFNAESPVGATVTGSIIDVVKRQITDYATGAPKFFDDGGPQEQIVIRLQTTLRDDGDDDGIRGIYIKTWNPWKEALAKAITAAGGKKASDVLRPGAQFTATYTGTQSSSVGSPTKVYSYTIVPPSTAAVDNAVTPAPTATAPASTPAAAGPAATPPSGQNVMADSGDAAKVDTAKALIGLGQSDEVIATATGLSREVIAALRNV